jgi:hypothetical protein
MAAAALPFFFHVRDFPAGRELAIPADHAAARQRREPEKPNDTHDTRLQRRRSASFIPEAVAVMLIDPRSRTDVHIGATPFLRRRGQIKFVHRNDQSLPLACPTLNKRCPIVCSFRYVPVEWCGGPGGREPLKLLA